MGAEAGSLNFPPRHDERNANDMMASCKVSRKYLKHRRRSARNCCGAVAELVKVPENVESAIETALGGALQNIVMRDEADAVRRLPFLKRRQMGRATFLPMNVIRGRRYLSMTDEFEVLEGFVGIAVDLVSFESDV